MPSGARYRFVENTDGTTYVPPAGRKDVLVKNGDGSWDLSLEKSKSRYHFASDGTHRTTTDDFGNVTNLAYDVNGVLQTVADAASGRSVSVTWVNGRISSVSDSSSPPRVVQYGYDPSTGKLTTDPANRVTSYVYQSGRFSLLLKQILDN